MRVERSVSDLELLLVVVQTAVFLLPALNVLHLALVSTCKILRILRLLQRMPLIQQLQTHTHTHTDMQTDIDTQNTLDSKPSPVDATGPPTSDTETDATL